MYNHYNPHNHFWLRNDGSVYSSAHQCDILQTDPLYQQYEAWLEAGNAPTFYPKDKNGQESPVELQRVLDTYGLRAYPPTLEEAKDGKLRQIDAETSAAIVAGFDYEVDGEILHFAYDTNDQQNFADTANMVNLSLKGIPGVPESIPWNGWKIERDETGAEVSRYLVRLDLDANAFLALYMQGAMMHKAGLMELGGQRKAQVDAATTIEELEGI